MADAPALRASLLTVFLAFSIYSFSYCSSRLTGSYLFFLLAAIENLPKEAESVVYRGVGPDAMQA